MTSEEKKEIPEEGKQAREREMSRICDNSFVNRPLFEALRQVHDLPIVNHGIRFVPEKEREEHRIISINYRDDPHWKDVNMTTLSCRLQEDSFYVQYTSKDAGLLTLKVDLPRDGGHRTPFTLVAAEEFPPCRERRDKSEDEHSFYGHDATGTEEWTWSWVESKEDNSKEKRQKQLAEYILPTPVEGEGEDDVVGIPHRQCLTNYRLCEVRDLEGVTRHRLLTSKYQGSGYSTMYLCCGDIFSGWGANGPTLLSSGIAVSESIWFRNIIGIYSGSMNYCYALCYCFEGLYVVVFKLQTVNP